jgi:hypothetical protein
MTEVVVEKGHTVRKTTNRGLKGTVYNTSQDGMEVRVGWSCGHITWEPVVCVEVQVRWSQGRKLVWVPGTYLKIV